MGTKYKRRSRIFLCAWIAAILLSGCGSSGNPDVYHVGTHEWMGDSIFVHLHRTSAPLEKPSLPSITVDCRSCNLTNSPQNLVFNDSGVARIYLPETRDQISARLHLHGSGIDTTFIQTQRPPSEATRYFHLPEPLVGRVFVDQFALLYSDTTKDSVVANANVGDELNIFGSGTSFYRVHHPNFNQPLYLLKADAIRLE
jgi:hypothetical protein